jgi:hypothetical protein
MAKKNGRNRKGGRTTPKGTRPAGTGSRDPFGGPPGAPPWADPLRATGPFGDVDEFDPFVEFDPEDADPEELMAEVQRGLRSDEPLDLLMMASTILSAVDPRHESPVAAPSTTDRPPLRDLVDSFIEVDRPETAGLLAVFAQLVPDEVLRRRIRRSLDPDRHGLPGWLGTLDTVQVTRVVEQSQAFDRGHNVILGVGFGAHEFTIVAYVDHSLGTIVKDAFVVPGPTEGCTEFIRSVAGNEEFSWIELDRAEARARVADAIDAGSRAPVPFETDTWPSCRPLLEWVIGQLPEGGRGYTRPVRSPERQPGPGAPFAALGDVLGDVLGNVPRDVLGNALGDVFTDLGLDVTALDLVTLSQRLLEDRAGGAGALAALDDSPLPDEAFDWAGIDGDIGDRVAEVLALGDRVAEDHFGEEFRTATRRLLARIARGGPEIFHRRGAASSAAAAIAWLVARDNDALDPATGGLCAKDLLSAFGRSGSVSQRAGTMVRTAGLAPHADAFRCPPDLLVSSARADLLAERDYLGRLGEVMEDIGAAEPLLPGPSPRRRPAGDASGTVHRLKVTLEQIRPPIWRRLLVPSDLTLGDLHQVLQAAFDWYDGHLHDFDVEVGRFVRTGDGLDEWDDPFSGPSATDEDTVSLAEVAGKGTRMVYTYDFGDGWRHRIEVEAVEAREPERPYPVCTAGRRAAPPEDIGGPWGYGAFLEAIADPAHPDHDHYVEWFGDAFDPAAFDPADFDPVEIDYRLAALFPGPHR